MKTTLQACILALSLTVAATGAYADATRTDFQILARALSFLQSPPSGDVRVGVVYSSSEPSTRRHAEEIADLLGAGMRVGNINLRPVIVAADSAKSIEVDLFFVPDSFRGDLELVAAASKHRRIPCVTTDIGRVREGACTVGVRSQPKIEILVNRAMAADTGAAFATAFRMMITEI